MSTAMVLMAAGMALGFAAAFGGFSAFLIVFVLGVVGFLVGRIVDGDLHIADLFDVRERRRR